MAAADLCSDAVCAVTLSDIDIQQYEVLGPAGCFNARQGFVVNKRHELCLKTLLEGGLNLDSFVEYR